MYSTITPPLFRLLGRSLRFRLLLLFILLFTRFIYGQEPPSASVSSSCDSSSSSSTSSSSSFSSPSPSSDESGFASTASNSSPGEEDRFRSRRDVLASTHNWGVAFRSINASSNDTSEEEVGFDGRAWSNRTNEIFPDWELFFLDEEGERLVEHLAFYFGTIQEVRRPRSASGEAGTRRQEGQASEAEEQKEEVVWRGSLDAARVSVRGPEFIKRWNTVNNSFIETVEHRVDFKLEFGDRGTVYIHFVLLENGKDVRVARATTSDNGGSGSEGEEEDTVIFIPPLSLCFSIDFENWQFGLDKRRQEHEASEAASDEQQEQEASKQASDADQEEDKDGEQEESGLKQEQSGEEPVQYDHSLRVGMRFFPVGTSDWFFADLPSKEKEFLTSPLPLPPPPTTNQSDALLDQEGKASYFLNDSVYSFDAQFATWGEEADSPNTTAVGLSSGILNNADRGSGVSVNVTIPRFDTSLFRYSPTFFSVVIGRQQLKQREEEEEEEFCCRSGGFFILLLTVMLFAIVFACVAIFLVVRWRRSRKSCKPKLSIRPLFTSSSSSAGDGSSSSSSSVAAI
ncbi:hypothetical protein QOT17_019177 [Balamuthia mandrillaris]